MAKILSIVETAYRATLEEQDDTILWLNAMFKNNGADVTLLLRSNAVNYAVNGQDATGLQFGDIKQIHPPTIDHDLEKMISNGITVYAVSEDLKDRGISEGQLVNGVRQIPRRGITKLMEENQHIWHW